MPGPDGPARRRFALAWLGALPFFAYAALFLLLPAGDVLVGAFRSDQNAWTTANIGDAVPRPVPARVRELDPHQPLHGDRRRLDRSADVLRGAPPRGAALGSHDHHRVLGCRVAVRRSPARLLLHLEHRHARRRDAVPQGLPRPRHLRAQHHRLRLLGRLPRPMSTFRFRSCCSCSPGRRRAQGEWREASESLGGGSLTYWRASAFRCWPPPSSVRWCCSSATPSRRRPPPTR